LADIRALIAEARRQTTVAVNMGLTLLYWRIGQHIHREVLGSERAAYGEQIVVTVSRQLVERTTDEVIQRRTSAEWFSLPSCFPEQEIVATLSRQLSWSHRRIPHGLAASRGSARKAASGHETARARTEAKAGDAATEDY